MISSDSTTPGDLLTELRRRDIALWRDGDNLRFSAPAGALTPALREEMIARKAELLAQLAEHAAVCEPPIPRADRSTALPLSFSQERLWLLDQIDPGQSTYNIEQFWRIRGPLDVPALERALNEITRRHEILRTTVGVGPVQVIHPIEPRPLHVIDATPADLDRLAREEAACPFDLARGPLWRATLLRFSENDHALLLTWHHIVIDAWSVSVFMRELATFYTGQTLPELPIQFADFAKWQRDSLVAATPSSQEGELAASSPDRSPGAGTAATALPGDRPRPARQSYRGASAVRDLPPELASELRRFAREENVTLFTLLLAGWNALLARCTGEHDSAIGSPIAQRSRVETENVIGFFLNMLALRTDLAGDPSFREVLRRVRATVLEGFAHQDVPFEKIVEALHPARTLSHHPVFQVAFVLAPGGAEPPQLPGLTIEPIAVPATTAKFDLTLFIEETGETLRAKLEYATDQFDAATAERMLASLEVLFRGVLANPATPLSLLPLLPAAERRRLLIEWNDTAREFPRDRTVHELFEEIAARQPEAPAIVDGSERVSYAELKSRSDAIARDLLERQGVRPGHLVGLPAERSAQFIAGVLGILKAGGAYVPLDPNEPAERLSGMGFQPVSSGTGFQPVASHVTGIETVSTHERLEACPTNSQPAYVLFTSGSTGTPKGVVVPHCAISRLVINNDYAPFTANDRVAFASNVCFDAATFEIWGALLNGGTLVVTPHETLLAPRALEAHIAGHGITTLFLTTSLFNRLAHESPAMFRSLRTLIFGGEAADAASVRRVLESGKPQRLVNGYGPTETTTFAICHEIDRIDGNVVPIGKPIANTTAYILDSAHEPVPIGVVGEIYIGGPGVALGYHHAPELTAQRFLETPYGRLYRTGDLARWRNDGTIEFRGRIDEQIKLRGFRIEPGEIEHAMRQIPGVADCRVVCCDAQLAAYFIASNGSSSVLPPNGGVDAPIRDPSTRDRIPSDEQLRTALARILPAQMIPTSFVAVPDFPLNANGKLDASALPRPQAHSTRSDTAALTPLETEVAALWAEVLGRDNIARGDDFFAIGGHSLLAIRMLGRVREKFGVDLPVRRLFETPTVEGVAAFIAEHRSTVKPLHSLVPIQRGDPARRPFFLVPGGWGGETEFLVYARLRHHIGPELPIYGLKARGADGAMPKHESVREMVADYIAEIRTLQPRGPYLLGGECVGGVVAYEMARQLETEGENVALLVLLDTGRPNRRALRTFRKNQRAEKWRRYWRAKVSEPACRHWQQFSRLTLGEKIRYVWRRATRERQWPRTASASPAEAGAHKVFEHYPRLLMGYKIGAYRGRVTLLVPEESHRKFGNQGWDDVSTGGLDVHVLPGDHVSYIREHAAIAAAKLRELIRSCGAPATATAHPSGGASQLPHTP